MAPAHPFPLALQVVVECLVDFLYVCGLVLCLFFEGGFGYCCLCVFLIDFLDCLVVF